MDQPGPRSRKGQKYGTDLPAADHAIAPERAQDPDEVHEYALSQYGLVGIELAEALRGEKGSPTNPNTMPPPNASTLEDIDTVDEVGESEFYPPPEQSAECADEHFEEYRKDPDNPDNIDRLIANEMVIWLSSYGPLALLPYIFDKYRIPQLSDDIDDLAAQSAALVAYMQDRYNLPLSLRNRENSPEGESDK